MENNTKPQQRDYLGAIIFFSLIIMLFIRSCIIKDDSATTAINIINYVGMILSLETLLRNIVRKFETRTMKFIGCIAIIIILIYGIYKCCQLGLGLVVFSDTKNDCITIMALLFALPSDWLCQLIDIFKTK